MRRKGVLFGYFALLTIESLPVSDAGTTQNLNDFLQNSLKNTNSIPISNAKPTHLNLAKPVVYNKFAFLSRYQADFSRRR